MTGINYAQQTANATIILSRLIFQRDDIDPTDVSAVKAALEEIAPPPDNVDYTYLAENITFVAAILRYKENTE